MQINTCVAPSYTNAVVSGPGSANDYTYTCSAPVSEGIQMYLPSTK